MRSTLHYDLLIAKALRVSPSSAFLLATVLSACPASNNGAKAASSSVSTVGRDPGAMWCSPSRVGVLQAWLSEATLHPSRSTNPRFTSL